MFEFEKCLRGCPVFTVDVLSVAGVSPVAREGTAFLNRSGDFGARPEDSRTG
jgi:hypothetical protein